MRRALSPFPRAITRYSFLSFVDLAGTGSTENEEAAVEGMVVVVVRRANRLLANLPSIVQFYGGSLG